jgi:PAS domain S-box-containing protein
VAESKNWLQKATYLLRGGDCLRGVEDEDTARAFHVILCAFLSWLFLALSILLPWFAIRKAAVAAILGFLCATAMVSLALLRRSYKRAAAILFVSVAWCAVEIFSFFSRGVHSPTSGWSFVIIILAGWLLGSPAAIRVATASLLILLAEAIMEENGYPLPAYFPGEPMGLWILYVMFLVLAIVPILAFQDELRRQLSALRDSEDRFSSLSNAALEGIMIHENGMILDVNMAYAKLFGYEKPEELIGQYGPTLLLAPEFRELIVQRIENRETGVMELTGLRKDGSTFPGEIDSRPINYRGRKAVLVATRDLTERKRAEEERKTLLARLIQAHKMELIGRLVGSISHDFNNLLTVIIGSSELALERVEKADPLRESLEEIYGAGQRAAGLTQQLLAFSRKQVLHPRVVDLNGLVSEMQPILARVVGKKAKLTIDLKSEPLTIRADPLQMDSVIMNLVVNARDAMPRGGSIRIETGTVNYGEAAVQPDPSERVGTYVTLSVRDWGVGMNKELQSHIFDPFFTTKEVGKGTGLGLSVTLGIVEQSGGAIEVKSEPGQGTTFTVFFPLVEDAVVEPERQEVVPGVKGTATILVAEDHPDVRKFTVSALRSYGYRVIEADNSEHVLGLINRERGRVDLIVTDVVMPELGGREMVTVVRNRWPHVKVVFMSGYSEDAVLLHGVLEKNSTFIEKPFTPSQLAAKVQELMTQSDES